MARNIFGRDVQEASELFGRPDLSPTYVPPESVTWVPPGQSVDVHGIILRDGFVYAGKAAPTLFEAEEPSLIDLALPVKGRAEPSFGYDDYWLSYRSFEPAERREYLAWLADGRRARDVPFEFVMLFLFGLERRACVDIPRNRRHAWELPLIRDEVSALRDRYRRLDWSFDTYLEGFLAYIDVIAVDPSEIAITTPPALREDKFPPPIELGLGLGAFVSRKQPIPPDWALAWAWYLPDVRLRLAVTRAVEEFSRLFMLRYQEQFGEGIKPRAGKQRMQVSYKPENYSIGAVLPSVGDIPDVFLRQSHARSLGDLFNDTVQEIDPYSRWLARNPDKEGTIAAVAHLPARLLREPRPEVTTLLGWIDRHLGQERCALVDANDVLELWSPDTVAKQTKAESLAMARVFQRFDIGIEPDVRFGGAVIAPGKPVVIYRVDSPIADEPSVAYAPAATVAYLGAALLTAEGPVVSERLAEMVGAIALMDGLPGSLSSSEMARLHALLVGLIAGEIKLTGLKRRLDDLTVIEREATADLLISIATAEGAVAAPSVAILIRIFRLLDLDPESVTSRLHAGLTGATGNRNMPTRTVTLDRATIAERERETDVVSELLGTIFTQDDAVATSPVNQAEPVNLIAGLDAAHSGFVRALATKRTWTVEEFAALAQSHHLLVAGAIDVINDVAFELTDDPLIEGDGPFTIDADVLQAFMS